MVWQKARTMKWLVISIVVTVAGTALLWTLFGQRALFGFLFLPFLPFAFGGGRRGDGRPGDARAVPICPRCDYKARGPEERYCPRDGSSLV